jgi:hypothetical protein
MPAAPSHDAASPPALEIAFRAAIIDELGGARYRLRREKAPMGKLFDPFRGLVADEECGEVSQ